MKCTTCLIPAAAAAFLVGPASAEVLVYEGFDYGLGALNGNAGGQGWNGAWQTDSQGGSISGTGVVAGLTLSDYPVLGNAAEVLSNYNGQISGTTYAGTTAGRQTAAGLAAANSPTTFFTSFLFRQDETDNSFANESTFAFGATAAGGQNRLISRPVDLFDSDDPQNVAVGAGNEATVGTAGIEIDTTYLVISKFENINAPVFGGNDITATLWALDAAGYDAVKSGGITEAELTANAVATATRTDVGPAFPPSLVGGEFARLRSVTGFGLNNRSQFDELRLFTDLNDVNTVIPEPASLALLGLGGLCLRVRRRSS
jgi:hypothetical protein